MKLVIIAILFLQTLALRQDAGAESNHKDVPHRSEATAESQQWYYYTPYYYTYPVYSWSYSYWPSYYYIWRTGEDNNEVERKDEKQQKFDPVKANEELVKLKKEIWGKEDFSTEEIRKEKKAYDPRWLIAQLKISRALELEDMIKNPPKEEKKSLRVGPKEESSTKKADAASSNSPPKKANSASPDSPPKEDPVKTNKKLSKSGNKNNKPIIPDTPTTASKREEEVEAEEVQSTEQ